MQRSRFCDLFLKKLADLYIMNSKSILTEIQSRHSSRMFNPDRMVTDEDLNSLLEAAHWAPSSSNMQPWRWVIGKSGTSTYQTLLGLLMPGNQTWAKYAPVLLLVASEIQRTTNTGEKANNRTALYDTGMANMALAIEATRRGLNLRMMGGFNLESARKLMPEGLEPVCVIALGYKNDGNHLPEDIRARELQPRSRKTIEELIVNINI